MTAPDEPAIRIVLASDTGGRRCGDCQLCCKLLPTKEIGKPGNARCPHQRHGVGCTIYANRPRSCAWWSCRWLVNDDTADLRRPDRSHYVIDVIPDHITALNNKTGERTTIPIVQVWVDPKHREAHRDPALRRYILRRAEDGWATLIRFDVGDALFIAAPPLTHDGQWHETVSMERVEEHSLLDTIAALTGEPHAGNPD